MLEHGDNLAKARDIDFNHVFESEEDAQRFLAAAKNAGYQRVSYAFEEETGAWGVLIKIYMLPTHEDITREELKLDSLAREFSGRADGWGCMQVD